MQRLVENCICYPVTGPQAGSASGPGNREPRDLVSSDDGCIRRALWLRQRAGVRLQLIIPPTIVPLLAVPTLVNPHKPCYTHPSSLSTTSLRERCHQVKDDIKWSMSSNGGTQHYQSTVRRLLDSEYLYDNTKSSVNALGRNAS